MDHHTLKTATRQENEIIDPLDHLLQKKVHNQFDMKQFIVNFSSYIIE